MNTVLQSKLPWHNFDLNYYFVCICIVEVKSCVSFITFASGLSFLLLVISQLFGNFLYSGLKGTATKIVGDFVGEFEKEPT